MLTDDEKAALVFDRMKGRQRRGSRPRIWAMWCPLCWDKTISEVAGWTRRYTHWTCLRCMRKWKLRKPHPWFDPTLSGSDPLYPWRP